MSLTTGTRVGPYESTQPSARAAWASVPGHPSLAVARSYAATADGQRLLANLPIGQAESSPIMLHTGTQTLIGQSLSHNRISVAIGAGGMDEVYRRLIGGRRIVAPCSAR